VKSPLPPRWARDQVRVLQPDSISKAFDQLDKIRHFLDCDHGSAFLFDQVRTLTGASVIDAITPAPLIATSDNAGAFFPDRGAILDFRTLERLLSRSDGDIAYVLEFLRSIPKWADNCVKRITAEVRIGDFDVTYEGVTVAALMDFRPAGSADTEPGPARLDS